MPLEDVFDLLIVGGGVNGTGIARDAAGRGLRVLLVEQGDLAGATSSASTKLVHGGLRYLEHYEFRLVREALKEREVLLDSAPHIIWPLAFVLPHERSLRPAWMIRLGLVLYDHLGGRMRLPASYGVDLRKTPFAPLRPEFKKGFVYSDCWVQDARLVVLNAIDARERGAAILTRTACVAARRQDGLWAADTLDTVSGVRRQVRARALINATGPWVGDFIGEALKLPRPNALRLVKGSHVVVKRLYEGEHAFILQNSDRRIVFAIPYERRYTLIGTTDVPFEGDPGRVAISPEEASYLCEAVNRHFATRVTPADVRWSYAGVRPLYDDATVAASEATRDYVLDLTDERGRAPLLNVFGGKITTYRRLAEHVMLRLARYFPQARGPWTAGAKLPGGDMPGADFERYLAQARGRYPWLPAEFLWRLARNYGTRMERLLDGARRLEDLGRHFGGDFYEREARYLVDEEWAREPDDVLWRRSKLGLHLSAEAKARLADWFGLSAAGAQPLSRAPSGS